MTIHEMISNGIEFQGDDIRVMIWSHSEERYIFNERFDNIPSDRPEICEMDVGYIYSDNDKLVIELKSED